MPKITPFSAIRPSKDHAAKIAALPYDVYNRKEATEIVASEPLSFLKIDRAETSFPEDVSTYDDRVYFRAKELLGAMIDDGAFIIEDNACYYIYELKMGEHIQTGIAACSAVSDYEENRIKKHENTRPEKELDRIRHIDITNAHTGPIFMAYRRNEVINGIVAEAKKAVPEYDFTSSDGIRHRVWVINESKTIIELEKAFLAIPATYIADGHHRCASAVKVAHKRKAENPRHQGNEEYNRFLSVLFPDDELKILPYNRVVADLNGLSIDELIKAIESQGFLIEHLGEEAYAPDRKGCFGMYLRNGWYRLTAKTELLSADPVAGLDVAILQDYLLKPVFGIDDPRTDKRIDFVGGIRGLHELEKRASSDMMAAFSMYATSIQELLAVADAGLLMPPKSTWFEPKLRSGLFIHALNNVPI
ncbi:MAG: DUF1015 family protein [Lachnospiraceae bacterium]|nr:DUF1015 family protein [Lachnospiraceae bacterium]